MRVHRRIKSGVTIGVWESLLVNLPAGVDECHPVFVGSEGFELISFDVTLQSPTHVKECHLVGEDMIIDDSSELDWQA
jgi:hypothetical protein